MTIAALALLASCETGTGTHAPASSALERASATSAPSRPAPIPVTANAPAPNAAPSVAEPSASGTPQRGAPCNVAFIGDSITDYRSFGGGYVRFLEQRCPQSRFSNFAKGGAMVNQMRARFEASLANEPRGTFSHVVVFGGVNDLYSDETAGRTTTKIESDLAAIYAASRALGARVVAITVAPWGGFTRYFTPHRAETTRELNAWIRAQPAAGTVDTVADAFALLSCGDADRLCARYERTPSDGLHFGPAGHEALGAALYAAEFQACP